MFRHILTSHREYSMVNSPDRRGRRGGSAGRGEWGCVDRREGGRKEASEFRDVASETEEAKAA
jgi:hypothetical protein